MDGLHTEKEYRRLAKSFRFYKLASLALCLIFVVGGLMVFKNDITLENLRYLVKYLDLGSGDISSGEATIDFDSGEASGGRVGIYKNDLVLVNHNNFEVFDFRSGKIYNDTFSMTEPTLSVSAGHVLVYDLGGKQARLYNSFSLLKEELFDYPIFCADTDDSGRYAIATSEKNYHCAVYVYDSSFSRVFKWLSADKFVSDVALGADGTDRLAVAALKASGGDFVSDLLIFSTRDPDHSSTYSFPGEMPLKTYVTAEKARLLTDRALHFITQDSGETVTVSFDSEKLSMYGFFTDYSVVVLNDNTVGIRQEALICDSDGQRKTSFVTVDPILDIAEYEKDVYFLLADRICRMDVEGGSVTEYPVEGEYTRFFITGKEAAVLVNSSGARHTVLTTQPDSAGTGME